MSMKGAAATKQEEVAAEALPFDGNEKMTAPRGPAAGETAGWAEDQIGRIRSLLDAEVLGVSMREDEGPDHDGLVRMLIVVVEGHAHHARSVLHGICSRHAENRRLGWTGGLSPSEPLTSPEDLVRTHPVVRANLALLLDGIWATENPGLPVPVSLERALTVAGTRWRSDRKAARVDWAARQAVALRAHQAFLESGDPTDAADRPEWENLLVVLEESLEAHDEMVRSAVEEVCDLYARLDAADAGTSSEERDRVREGIEENLRFLSAVGAGRKISPLEEIPFVWGHVNPGRRLPQELSDLTGGK